MTASADLRSPQAVLQVSQLGLTFKEELLTENRGPTEQVRTPLWLKDILPRRRAFMYSTSYTGNRRHPSRKPFPLKASFAACFQIAF